MKRFLAVVLAALMVVGICAVPVMAAAEQEALPEAFYVYSGESGVTEMSGVPAMSGWTVCQTVNIAASTGKVGIAQISPDGETWDTGVIYDVETGAISSQLGGDVTVKAEPVVAAGETFFAVTFDGTTESVYINGALAATVTGFDADLVSEYLAPAFVCADACYDASVPGFVTSDGITTESLSVFAYALSATQIGAIYDSLGLGDSNYASVVAAANKWYSLDFSNEMKVNPMVYDLASLGAPTTGYMMNGYTKVTTIRIPERTYQENSIIGIAQIRGETMKSFFLAVAYDLGTGKVSIPWANNGADWWVVDTDIARPATGNVQFIETMDPSGNLTVYVNGQVALKVHPNPDAKELDGSSASIMKMVTEGNSNAVLVLGDYLSPQNTNTYDAHYYNENNGAYSSWDASYLDNSFTKYGTAVISAKGYMLPANEAAIASFYKGGAGVDSFNTVSNLSELGNWYSENFYDLSDIDNPVLGLTAPTEYTYNNEGISLADGYTKVAVYYMPDNSDGHIKENEGWVNIFSDDCPEPYDDKGAYDGIRYDIGSGMVASTCAKNFYRWGQVPRKIKTGGFTVFAMTFDGHTLRVWINGELAFYASDNEALPVNSYPYGAFAQTSGAGVGDRGLDLVNHTTAVKNCYVGDTAYNVYEAYGVMLSYEAGFTGVANMGAIAQLSASAAEIAETLSGTHVHTWGTWTTDADNKPTCTTDGTQSRTCDVCGKTESRVASALGHKWSAWTITKAPTLTENGSKYRTCTRTGCTEVQTVEIEPLVSAVNFSGAMGTSPYFTFDFSEDGGLTEVKVVNNTVKSKAFTSQTKISVIKIPNRIYAAGSVIGIAPMSEGTEVNDFDTSALYDLGTGLVTPFGLYKDIIEQNAVKATGTVQFIEVLTGAELRVYVNGELALVAQNSGDAANNRALFTSGKYKIPHLNIAADKKSDIYALYGAKTLYGAVYNDVEMTDTLIAKLYKMVTPALEQIISTTLPGYQTVTGKANWRPNTNFLSEGGSGMVTKTMMSGASYKLTSQLLKITTLNIPDVIYGDDMTVGISLMAMTTKAGSYDYSVQYNLKTGRITPATTKDGTTLLTDITVDTPVKATGYVQFVEVFTGTHLDVYVNGQLAFAANIPNPPSDVYNATYRSLTLNATGDGSADAATACNGVKTMYFLAYVNPTTITTAKVAELYDLFLESLTRMEPAEPVACSHDHTEVRGAKEATCTAAGYTGDTYCADCGEKLASGEATPKLEHVLEIRNAKEATCTENGYTGDVYCTLCGEKQSSGEAIPATGHHFVDGVCSECGEKQVLAGFVTIDGKLYYYENGKQVTGWFEVDGVTYFAGTVTGVVVNYSKVIGQRMYLWNDETGLVIANGFVETTGGTVCYENGFQVIGWRHADGSGPVVGADGISEQYSTSPNNLYYFLSSTGYMVTSSTYTLGGYLREFNDDHTVKPLNGLQRRYGGELYYYVDGVIQTGWHTIDGNTYYFQASDAVYGRAASKWMYIGNKIYYFYANVKENANACTLKTSGTIGGIAYNYAEDGHILYNGFVNCDYANMKNGNIAAYIQMKNGTTRYYVNGEMQTGWQQIGGKWYYFYAIGSTMGSGYMCVESRYIRNVWYEFTADGVCTSKQ